MLPSRRMPAQQMLGANVGIAAPDGVLQGNLQHVLGPGAQVLSRAAGIGGTRTGGFADHLRQQVIRQARLCQYRVGKPLVLSHQAQQQMFCPHIAVTQFASGFLGQLQGFFRSGSEFTFVHNAIPLFLIVKCVVSL